ncbi:MAG TPA: efflux RND transporter periplasmic adaptor subunit [Polyangiaceae bacterium]|jgi:HlyD family secretion protein|nr:efflux RND transporter periplasmic adaptor subunit [Polyangiaceae bacterium]
MSASLDNAASAARRTAPADAARALERELAGRGRKRWLTRGVALLVMIAAVLGGRAYYEHRKPPPLPRFITQKVAARDIVEEVQSTGKVKPLKEVQVGAQVSGRVVQVAADFNSTVKKGDLLAEIDPRVFGAQVTQTRAQIDAAKAQVKRAEATLAVDEVLLARLNRLVKDSLTTQAEVDQAAGNRDVAKADVAAAEAQLAELAAQLSSAATTLQYTRILAPIDGIVITRSIDPGQTVAASFAAPVLFVIAPDLRQMQVLADIDEADVGKVKEGMIARVVVDAFPGETFSGKVTQIRYSPNEVQGVVTYSAVIDVSNPELKLRPGMTATVTIETKRVTAAASVPNSALRFRPVKPDQGPPGSASATPAVFGTELKAGEARLYVPTPGSPDEPLEKAIGVGITDGRFTAVTRGVAIGDDVITEQRDAKRPDKFLGLF